MRALVVLGFVVACGTAAPTPASVQSPPPPPADPWTSATLARSNATGAVPPGGLKLVVSTSALTLADGTRIVPVPADASRGVDATYKRAGQNDLYIEPLGRIVRAQPEHEALLAVDPSVSYRLLVEVLYTLGQNEVSTMHFLVRTPSGTATIDPTLPHADPSARATSLGLLVLIVRDGISMKTRGGNIAPGCNDAGAGLAIPNKDGARDMTALATCASRLKNVSPEFASETSVTVVASPTETFQTLVTTMDALRPTFPSVTFGVPK